jgi:hypothetical protein
MGGEAELELDGFFPSGPVEIRPVHFWRQTGKNPVSSGRMSFPSGPVGPDPDCRTGSNSEVRVHTHICKTYTPFCSPPLSRFKRISRKSSSNLTPDRKRSFSEFILIFSSILNKLVCYRLGLGKVLVFNRSHP